MDDVIVAVALILLPGGGGGGDGDEAAVWWWGSCALSGVRASGIPIRPMALERPKQESSVRVEVEENGDMNERRIGRLVEGIRGKMSYVQLLSDITSGSPTKKTEKKN